MWCTDCQNDFATVPGSIVQVCPGCQEASSSKRRIRRVPKLHVVTPLADEVARATSKVHVPVASNSFVNQSVAYKSDSNRSAQDMATVSDRRSEQLESINDKGSVAQQFATSFQRPVTHRIVYGLFVFLVGQALQIWALLQERLFAWSLANLVSIIGMTLALTAAVVSLKRFDRRLSDLARIVGRSENSSTPNRTFSRRV